MVSELNPQVLQFLPELDAAVAQEHLALTLGLEQSQLPLGTSIAEHGERESGGEAVTNDVALSVREWVTDLYTAELDRLGGELGRGIPWKVIQKRLPKDERTSEPSPRATALVAAVRVEKTRRSVLTAIGLERIGAPPFDQYAQRFLPDARSQAAVLSDSAVAERLALHLRATGAPYKRATLATASGQREEVAWAVAKRETEKHLINIGAASTTRAELDAMHAKLKQRPVSLVEERTAPRDSLQLVDSAGNRIPSSSYFSLRGASPLTVEEWCTLPTRPVIIPSGRPEPGVRGMAEYLFESILYSPHVCDRRGQAVGLSQAKRDEYINKLMYSIERDLPIIASEYMPLVAIGNPIKRNTQEASLTEIDIMRRLSEIAHAVELQYEPGMQWLVGNEAPAFQGPEFNLDPGYVGQFHNDCAEIIRMVDPTGKRLKLFDEATMLWGTPERQQQWDAYEATTNAALHEAYENSDHPNHAAVVQYISTYIYPMATCVNPYCYEEAQDMTVRQIAEVYAAVKAQTGSVIRGVGSLGEASEAPQRLTAPQQNLLHLILDSALERTFRYRVAMDSRDELPAFKEIIPWQALAHTMVTKREKMVLFPNSGRGAYFPAHGEPVLVRSRDDKQRSVVTVRPWWHIASHPEDYLPMYVSGRDEPLYFEQAA
jgi:hypothetical protein